MIVPQVIVTYANSNKSHSVIKFKELCLAALGGSWVSNTDLVVRVNDRVELTSNTPNVPCFELDRDFLGRKVYFEIGEYAKVVSLDESGSGSANAFVVNPTVDLSLNIHHTAIVSGIVNGAFQEQQQRLSFVTRGLPEPRPEVTGDLRPEPVVDMYNAEIKAMANYGVSWGNDSYPEHADPNWFGGSRIGYTSDIYPNDIRYRGTDNAEASDVETLLVEHIQNYACMHLMRILVNMEGAGIIYDNTAVAHCRSEDTPRLNISVADSGPEPGHDAIFRGFEGKSITDFIVKLKNAYIAARNYTVHKQANVCHSSCHNNCHGSRNRR